MNHTNSDITSLSYNFLPRQVWLWLVRGATGFVALLLCLRAAPVITKFPFYLHHPGSHTLCCTEKNKQIRALDRICWHSLSFWFGCTTFSSPANRSIFSFCKIEQEPASQPIWPKGENVIAPTQYTLQVWLWLALTKEYILNGRENQSMEVPPENIFEQICLCFLKHASLYENELKKKGPGLCKNVRNT